MAQGRMSNTEKLPFSISPVDGAGNPSSVENLVVEPLDAADLTVEMTDATSGFIVSGSTLGDFKVRFRADARIGDGEVVVEEVHDVTVAVPEATTLGGTFGAPVPK